MKKKKKKPQNKTPCFDFTVKEEVLPSWFNRVLPRATDFHLQTEAIYSKVRHKFKNVRYFWLWKMKMDYIY